MLKVSIRDYWDRRPCNVRHSPEKPGSKRWAEQVTARKYAIEPHIPMFAGFRIWNKRDVLDAGCGIGIMATTFAKFGARVDAVDISQESLNLAMWIAAAYGVGDKVKLHWGDLEDLSPLPLTQYDLIWSFGVLHHTPNPELALQGFRKLVKPEGELRLMVYNRYSWKAWQLIWRHPLYALRHGIDATVALQSEAQSGCPLTRTYTPKSIKKLLEDNGWQVIGIWVDHIFPWYIPDYIQYRYTKEWYWQLVPGRVFTWLEERFGWHLMVQAIPLCE